MKLKLTLALVLTVLWATMVPLPFVPTTYGSAAEVHDGKPAMYYKSRLGLMPPAYLPDESRLNRAGSEAVNGFFQPFTVYSTGSWPEAVTSGEFSGDGRTDAALVTSFDFDPANDYQALVIAQTITGTLARAQSAGTGDSPVAVARGDFNHDGRDDLAIVNDHDNTLGVYLQSSTATLSSMITYPTGAGPDTIVVGDFNGDLRDDIAVGHTIGQSIALYYQQAAGLFAAPVFLNVGTSGFNDLAVGDLNGDSFDDLVLLRGSGYSTSQVAVFYQQNHALKAAPVFLTVETGGFLPNGLAIGDVTNDGRADVVVTAGGNTGQAYLNVFPQQVDGSLALSPTLYSAYNLPESVRVGDVNHDGRNDVMAVHAGWQALSIYTQTMTGTLNNYTLDALPYLDHYRPGALALADVTGDGSLDVLIANHSSLSAEDGLVVLTNTLSTPTSTITSPAAPGIYLTATVPYTIQGTSSLSAGTIELSLNGGQSWTPIPASINWQYTWTVPITDGNYVLLSRAVSPSGNYQSPSFKLHIFLDRSAPKGTLLINDGAAYTNQLTATLNISATDVSGVGYMRFADNVSPSGAWLTYTSAYPWVLPAGDGVKTVIGQAQDILGNISEPITDTILLDTVPPTGTITINGGAAQTESLDVALTLSATDEGSGICDVQLRNGGEAWGAWQTFSPALNWTLAGKGVQTVEVHFRDCVGNTSAAVSDSILSVYRLYLPLVRR